MISVVIITKNEEDNLRNLLPKLSLFSEIIVLDDNSNDKTKEIAIQHNAKVFNRTMDGYGNQKRYAVEKAQNNWILNLDADEHPSLELINEILTLKLEDISIAYSIPRVHVFMNKVFKYGKESNLPQLRLFNRTISNFNTNIVHEKVEHNGLIILLKNKLLHYSYKSMQHFHEKQLKYAQKSAQQLFEKGKKRNWIVIKLSWIIYFIKYYFIDLNFLNGYAGFTWSCWSSHYHMLKYSLINKMKISKKKF